MKDAVLAVGSGIRLGLLHPLAFAGLAGTFVVLLYADTARSLVAIWRSSDTYSYGFVVVPLVLWLLWRRRHVVAALRPEPCWPALSLVALAGLLWTTGRLADARVIEHFALVLSVQSAVVTVVGLRVAQAIAFPLAFLLFAVPVGEALVPTLTAWTADFTVAALKLTGVPVYREGNHFVIPTGRWSVVEACSGIRYLLATLMAGTLYAYLMYAGWRRRLAFIGASLVVPIVANWLRAYLIVMLGHLSGNELAASADHLIYGWVFFGIVLFVMFWVGAHFRQPEVPLARSADTQALRAAAIHLPAVHVRPALLAAAGAIAVSAAWLPVAASLRSAASLDLPELAKVPAEGGWLEVADKDVLWTPRFAGAAAYLRQSFVREDERVMLYVAYYRGQTEGAELVNSQNVLVSEKDPVWREVARGRTQYGDGMPARTSRLQSATQALTVVWWYWVDGRPVVSDSVAKLLLAASRLRLRGDDAAAVFVIVPHADGQDGLATAARFMAAMGPRIEQLLLQTRAGGAR
ncbi:MAG: exosortase A [Burkholderiaceae bacterium]|nr:exosortase A [Burkholderiaceae bacterium]